MTNTPSGDEPNAFLVLNDGDKQACRVKMDLGLRLVLANAYSDGISTANFKATKGITSLTAG